MCNLYFFKWIVVLNHKMSIHSTKLTYNKQHVQIFKVLIVSHIRVTTVHSVVSATENVLQTDYHAYVTQEKCFILQIVTYWYWSSITTQSTHITVESNKQQCSLQVRLNCRGTYCQVGEQKLQVRQYSSGTLTKNPTLGPSV